LGDAELGPIKAPISHHGGPSLVGDWSLYRPKLGVAQITFTANTFRESLTQVAGRESFLLEISGTYTLEGSRLRLNFNDADVAGKLTTAALQFRNSVRSSSQPMDFALDWKGQDLVYMTSSGSDTNMTMALARNGARPDLGQLHFSFSSSGRVGVANFAARTMGGGVLTPTTTFKANVGPSMTEHARNGEQPNRVITQAPSQAAQNDQTDNQPDVPVQVPQQPVQQQTSPAPDPSGGMPTGMPDPSTVPPGLPPEPTTAGGG